MLSVSCLNFLMILVFHWIHNLLKQPRLLIEWPLRNYRCSFMNSVQILHMVPNKRRLCEMFLSNKRLNNEIIRPPVRLQIWHQSLLRVIKFDSWPKFHFWDNFQDKSRTNHDLFSISQLLGCFLWRFFFFLNLLEILFEIVIYVGFDEILHVFRLQLPSFHFYPPWWRIVVNNSRMVIEPQQNRWWNDNIQLQLKSLSQFRNIVKRPSTTLTRELRVI